MDLRRTLSRICLLAVISSIIGTYDRNGQSGLPSAEGAQSGHSEEELTFEYLKQYLRNVGSVKKTRNSRTNDQHNYEKSIEDKIIKNGCVSSECESKAGTEGIHLLDQQQSEKGLSTSLYQTICKPPKHEKNRLRELICKRMMCIIDNSTNKIPNPKCSESLDSEELLQSSQLEDSKNETSKHSNLPITEPRTFWFKKPVCYHLIGWQIGCRRKENPVPRKRVCPCKLWANQFIKPGECPESCKSPTSDSIAMLCKGFGCQQYGIMSEYSNRMFIKQALCPESCKFPEELSIANICMAFGCYPGGINPYSTNTTETIFLRTGECPPSCKSPKLDSIAKLCKSYGCMADADSNGKINAQVSTNLFIKPGKCPESCKSPTSDSIAKLCIAFGCQPYGTRKNRIKSEYSQLEITKPTQCPHLCKFPDVTIANICMSFQCYPSGMNQNKINILSSQNLVARPGVCSCARDGLTNGVVNVKVSRNLFIKQGKCPEACKSPTRDSIAKLCEAVGCHPYGTTKDGIISVYSQNQILKSTLCPESCKFPEELPVANICMAFECYPGGINPYSTNTTETIFLRPGVCPLSCKSPKLDPIAKLCKSYGCMADSPTKGGIQFGSSQTHERLESSTSIQIRPDLGSPHMLRADCPYVCKNPMGKLMELQCMLIGCK